MFNGWDIKIDKKNGRYKKLVRVLGIPMSDGWEKLPEIKSVAITKRGMKQLLTMGISVVNGSTIGVEFYFVYLFGDKKNIRVEVCKNKSLSEAQTVANQLGDYFSVSVIDYTKEVG
jgi:hypothetical protein